MSISKSLWKWCMSQKPPKVPFLFHSMLRCFLRTFSIFQCVCDMSHLCEATSNMSRCHTTSVRNQICIGHRLCYVMTQIRCLENCAFEQQVSVLVVWSFHWRAFLSPESFHLILFSKASRKIRNFAMKFKKVSTSSASSLDTMKMHHRFSYFNTDGVPLTKIFDSNWRRRISIQTHFLPWKFSDHHNIATHLNQLNGFKFNDING